MKSTYLPVLFLVLVFTMLLVPGVVAWVDTDQPTQNVDGCGTMNTANAVYTFNQSIISNFSTTCFTITVDNIIINFAGFNIIGNNSGIDLTGIDATSHKNITINGQGGAINGFGYDLADGIGVLFDDVNGSTVRNLTITNSSVGFVMSSSNNNKFYNVTINNNSVDGLFLSSASSNTFYSTNLTNNSQYGLTMYVKSHHNTFYNTISDYNSNNGILLDNCSSNTFYYTTIINNNKTGLFLDHLSNYNEFYDTVSNYNVGEGVYVLNSIDNDFNNTVANNNIIDGIYVSLGADDNNFYYSITNNNTIHGVFISGGGDSTFDNLTSKYNTFVGIDMYASNLNEIEDAVVVSNGGTGVAFDQGSGNNTLTNLYSYNNAGKEIDSSDWATAKDNYLIYYNSFGLIIWKLIVDVEGRLGLGVGESIIIGNNSAYFNSSSDVSELNYSSAVGLSGLPTTFVNPQIFKDGVQCTDCVAITSLNAGNVGFTVQSWSKYNISEGPAPATASVCSAFTVTMVNLIPGFLVLAILVAGGIVFAVGFERNNLQTMMVSFVIIILGVMFVQIISESVLAAC